MKTGSFKNRVFRCYAPWLGGAENHEGIEVSDAQKAFILMQGPTDPGRGDLPPDGYQPSDLLQLEKEV